MLRVCSFCPCGHLRLRVMALDAMVTELNGEMHGKGLASDRAGDVGCGM
jgi:hypothetical protein